MMEESRPKDILHKKDGMVSLYVCKRPWDTDGLIQGFEYVLKFLVENTQVEYHVYLDESLRSHQVLEGDIGKSKKIQFINRKFHEDDHIDYVITLGGDGTILWAHKMFDRLNLPPFIAFTGGSLCFLSNFKIEEHESVIAFFHNHVSNSLKFRLKNLPRLTSYVCKEDSCDTLKKYVLNDVAIERTATTMVVLDLVINKTPAVTIRSDGLLISSSTGSTAYNLSLANGMIIHGDVECIIVNPMAPMSLSSRPIAIPPKSEIKVEFSKESRTSSRLVYDGVDWVTFNPGDYLVIQGAEEGLSMIVPEGYEEFPTWIEKLREIRGWK